MGKKRTRAKKTSRGERVSISRSTVRLVRDARDEGDKMFNKLRAWKAGKKGYVTVPNPNHHETDKPFIKVSFNAYFGGGRDFKSIRMGDNGSNSNKAEL
jgi:hypothetical protein